MSSFLFWAIAQHAVVIRYGSISPFFKRQEIQEESLVFLDPAA
jgi:hypothetical protein